MLKFLRACRLSAAVFSLLPMIATVQAAPVTALVVPAAAVRLSGALQALPAIAPPEEVETPPSLVDLVAAHPAPGKLDRAGICLAKAVYFEARGESLDGQLAVAEVVLNRTASDAYPDDICAVVTQRAQFSFVRRGHLPRADESGESWRRAVAIAQIARNGLVRSVPENVLWYHADYVSPSWGRRLTEVTRIGAHIFYS